MGDVRNVTVISREIHSSSERVCMYLCVGTCTCSYEHVIAIFLCLFSCYDMNSK